MSLSMRAIESDTMPDVPPQIETYLDILPIYSL
jgi:hypothetical protein